MISIMLLIAAFRTGDGITVLLTIVGLAVFWTFVISEIRNVREAKSSGARTRTAEQDPIDRHMDENYADIDWLRKGKL